LRYVECPALVQRKGGILIWIGVEKKKTKNLKKWRGKKTNSLPKFLLRIFFDGKKRGASSSEKIGGTLGVEETDVISIFWRQMKKR